MPSNYTPNYQLSQWEGSDAVRRIDFNADNAKIDAALQAGAAERTALSAALNAKANSSALSAETSARTAAVAALNTAVGKRGNCQIYTTAYTGNGAASKTLSFAVAPKFIAIIGPQSAALLSESACVVFSQDSSMGTVSLGAAVTWNGTQVTISHSSAGGCMNISGKQYAAIAFCDMS